MEKGVELNVILGIDLTASNKKITSKDSLHNFNPQ